MKRATKRARVFIAATFLGLFFFTSCGQADDEIFKDIAESNLPTTDEQNAKKQKPD